MGVGNPVKYFGSWYDAKVGYCFWYRVHAKHTPLHHIMLPYRIGRSRSNRTGVGTGSQNLKEARAPPLGWERVDPVEWTLHYMCFQAKSGRSQMVRP